MNSITPLPEALVSLTPDNHVYVGKGYEFRTNGRFEGAAINPNVKNPQCAFSKCWGGDTKDLFYFVPIGSEVHKLNPHVGNLPSPAPSVASVSVVTVPAVSPVATKPKRKRKPKTEYFFARINGKVFWIYKYSNRTRKIKHYSERGIEVADGETAKASVEYSRKYQKSCTRAEFLSMIKELGLKENGSKINPPKPQTPSLELQIEILKNEKIALKNENEILKNDYSLLKNENDALQEQNWMLKATKEGTDSAIVELKENIANLENQNEKLREIAKTIANRLQETVKKYNELVASF